MPQFQYQGVNESGGPVSGWIDAVDRRSAIAALARRGHFASDVTATPVSPTDAAAQPLLKPIKLARRRVSSKEILALTTQLSTALRSGLPLLSCLQVIEQQTQKPASKQLLADLSHSVSAGDSLSEAMAHQGGIFSPLYLAMIRVGETGGILEQTSMQLTGLLKRDEQIKSNIKNAAAYPLFVLGVGLISVIIVVAWILPRIIGTIVESGAALPAPTRMLMALSGFVQSYGWLVLIIVVAVAILLKKWVATSAGRIKWDSFKLKVPVLGQVLRSIAVGRFARTLGALTKGGITILEALGVVRDTLGNELLARQIDTVSEKVRAGEPLAEPLARSGYFPPLLVQIVSVGERTGKLDELLLSAAETFDAEADDAITRFMAILPAFLVLLLAVVIGFIVAATLLPIVVMELSASGL